MRGGTLKTTKNQRAVIEAAWKEVFQLSEVDFDRSFMDLGGTSLSANQLVAKLSRALGISVPVIKVFEYPTLRQFLRFLEGSAEASDVSPSQVGRSSLATLFF